MILLVLVSEFMFNLTCLISEFVSFLLIVGRLSRKGCMCVFFKGHHVVR